MSMEWVEIIKDLNAGTIGGVAGIMTGHPLDTIKVRLQTQCHTLKSQGAFHSFKQIAQSEGVRGFYKGMLSPIISNAPINAVVFAVYGQVSRVIQERNDSMALSPAEQFLAGATAGLFQVVFAAPSELVKITMQVDKNPMTKSSIQCAKDIFRTQGLYKGLYRGWQLNMMRDVPAFGAYFFTYDIAKTYLTNGESEQETTGNLLLAGGVAGSMSWMLTQPIDVVKTLVQSQKFETRLSTREIVNHHLALEGPQFLMKGFAATMMRAFPVSAVTFLVYERSMQIMS